ncbi:MAG: ABC transporter ATP-binding protein [Solirubrobacterales bacterium]
MSIDGLGLRLGDFALDVTMDVPGEGCLALVGPSGAGKTSLLRSVAGLTRPRSGRIACGGSVWTDTDRGLFREPEARRCGYLFQDYALFPHLSAWQNVAYGLRGSGAERRRRALELLDRFGLNSRAEARPRTLSGGERQRVALARALGVEPAALLLDEPLSALDASTRGRAARELRTTIEEAGVPTLLVTHDFTEAATLANEIGVIDGGRIVQRGTAADLAGAPRSAFVADLVGSVVLTGRAEAPGAAGTPVTLDSGATVWTTDTCDLGAVSLSVHPWEILIEPPGSGALGSARNRVPARVVSITPLGNRVRLGLDAGQPLAAEVTPQAVEELGLAPGREVLAVWKASATRVVEASR